MEIADERVCRHGPAKVETLTALTAQGLDKSLLFRRLQSLTDRVQPKVSGQVHNASNDA